MIIKSGNDKLKEHYGKYLVSFGKPKLIKLVNSANDESTKSWMLKVILAHADQALFDEVSAAIKTHK